METVLVGLVGVIVYLDDVVVYGSTKAEHDKRIEALMKRLQEYEVLLNHQKCIIGVKEIEFLGHVLSEEGVRPTDSRIAAVKNFREPKTIAELRSFLGLITYVGRFIPSLATKTEPLRRLLRTGSNFKWSMDQQEAFKAIKVAATDINYLGYFDRTDKTKLIVDASLVGLGALTDLEQKYFQTEREALAIVWRVEKFSLYLLGAKFELVTDCKALKFLFNPRSRPCPRIERWVLRIQSYNYDIKYEPGITNLADALSRLSVSDAKPFDKPVEVHIQHLLEYAVPEAVTLEKVIEVTKNDATLQKLINAFRTGSWSDDLKSFHHFKSEIHSTNGVLMRGDRLIIPEVLQHEVLKCAHEGHPGMSVMKRRLRQKVWWPKLDEQVEKHVKNCASCTLVSAVGPPEPMLRTKMPDKPWTDVAIDFLGPLPSGHYLLVLIDYFSRFTEVIVLNHITTELTVNALFETFSRFGVPETLRSDNGPQFTSESFRNFCKEFGINHQKTIPYWPQANGEVERMNSTILKRLRISQQEKKKHWKWDLRSFLLMYNSSPHSITGVAPSSLMFGRILRDKLPSVHTTSNIIDEGIRDRDWKKKLNAATIADTRRHATLNDLKEGDIVVAKRVEKENKLSSTYSPEQFEILSRTGADAEIRSRDSGKVYHRNVTHLKRLIQEANTDTHDTSKDSKLENQNAEMNSNYRIPVSNSDIDVPHEIRRSRRDLKQPKYFKNYVTCVTDK